MKDVMGEKRRHGGHIHAVGFGVGGRHAEHEEKPKEQKKLDMSGMSMDTLPHLTMPLGDITTLDLSNNNLQSIPESIIARLLNVVMLDVRSNQLTSLPNSIGCLSKLKVLNVSGNLLHSLPATIEECRALEELNANFNQLTKLPDTLGFELHGLRRLSVNSNKLAYLPSSTSHMTALRALDARLNCLRALPDGLENLGSLETLNVSQNFQYLRELPYGIGLLVSLRELDISYNSITALPDSMGCLTKLVRFSATGNPLVCPPMDVVEQSLDAMRTYLSARMNSTQRKKKSWVPKLVKFNTFSAGMMTPGRTKVHGNTDGLLMSDYRSLNGGIASPGFLSMLSPRRLFSPRRNSPKH
ncbi:plant intracellular Ras-group-related LRR protein 1-like [Phragmites australis]|uniref:plant intracellular Ras-group-related LRR protein 1-like n=1 Tax=Phragmites australis TaxID=29695 RepID=UPI002D7692FC|nr:plant intracellular Ras-group-related LRR protein 1-like [Phragmites australis]